jgi:ribosomal subunit interface protein
MNVVFRSPGMDSTDALRAYAERRLRFAIARVLDAASTAIVRISDLNGPRGGVDKRCRITVRDAGITAHAEAINGDSFAAVDLACDRIARVLRDDRAKSRVQLRRGRSSPRRAKADRIAYVEGEARAN